MTVIVSESIEVSTSSSAKPEIKVQEVEVDTQKSAAIERRVSTHTHIRGLGLSPEGYAEHAASGFIGQETAREVHFCDSLCIFEFL